MAKLAVFIVVSLLAAMAVAAQEAKSATYLPSPNPQGSPAPPLSPPTPSASLPTQASPPPTTSLPVQASPPPFTQASTPSMPPPPPSQSTVSPPIQALSPPSQPTTSPPIQASPPPSPPIQIPPPKSPPTASPPIQTFPPPSPPIQTPPPPTASSPPIQTPPSPTASPPPIQTPPPPTASPPPIQTPPLPTASPPPIQTPPTPTASPPPNQTPPPPTASPPPMQTPPPPTASPPPIQTPPPTTASPQPPVPVGLTVDFYKQSCPRAEEIVSEVVKGATATNPGVGGGLIRLAFHDCFVQGCDASVLLDPTPANPQPEKLGIPNYRSLRGFEVIDAAKSRLESACPGVVSCADIVQFAARDATGFLSGGRISYRLPGGRRDGRVSLASETLAYLPPPFYTIQQLVDNFGAKGLTIDDLVVLSGAHSVGDAHCSSCEARISQNLTSGGGGMNPLLAGRLRRQCPSKPDASNDPMVVQDFVTPNRMDNQYYRNVISRNCLFDSDAALLTSDQTALMVFFNAYDSRQWEQKFAAAMVKMAGIEVKSSADGEIRRNCRVVN